MSPSCIYLSHIHLLYVHHPTIYIRNYACIHERKAGVYTSPSYMHLSYIHHPTIYIYIRVYMKGRAVFT